MPLFGNNFVPLHPICAHVCAYSAVIQRSKYHLITVNETRQQKTKSKKPISHK